jgi:tetratricopeptide (TPR) repeat protein
MTNDNWLKYKNSGEQALTRGALGEAESMWLAALEEAEDFPENDSRRAITYEGLSEAYFRQGKNKDAEATCRRLLSLYRRVHGPDHIDVGITSSNLAMLLHMSHNYADAEPLYKQSIAIKTKVLGSNHPDVMRLLEGYADLLLKTHREAEARHLQVCAQGLSTGKWDRTKMDMTAMRANGQPGAQAASPANAPSPQSAPAAQAGAQVVSQPAVSASHASLPAQGQAPAQRPGQAPAQAPAARPAPVVAPSAPTADSQTGSSPINWFVYKEFAEEALRRGLMQVAETQWRAALVEAETQQLDKQKLAYALDSLADILCRIKKYEEAEQLMTRCSCIRSLR